MVIRSPTLTRGTGGAVLALAGATALAGLWRWKRLAHSMRAGESLADGAIAFQRPGATPHAPAVLVVGDSTGVGTGAARPEDSIAGRLAARFPNVTIVNRSANGARTLDVLTQLAAEGPGRYDMVLVHAGGNDVIRRTPLRALAPQVDVLMGAARRLSPNVIVTSLPNLGLVPMLFRPLSWWASRRSRQVTMLYEAAARRHGAYYADFFFERGTCPFAKDPARFYARDGLHPSGDLYGYVFERLMESLPIEARLTRPRLRPAPG
ncbi:MAG: GDSL-type esterase/lipase family protein [Burkholderiales bacterium]